jgi:hypothetical protein
MLPVVVRWPGSLCPAQAYFPEELFCEFLGRYRGDEGGRQIGAVVDASVDRVADPF